MQLPLSLMVELLLVTITDDKGNVRGREQCLTASPLCCICFEDLSFVSVNIHI